MTKFTDLKAIIVDATGTELTQEERELFSKEKPAGFILFKRNCVSKQQVTDLVASMRECVGRDDVPVLIDQEGGSVARLREPEFREYPSASYFADRLKSDLPRQQVFEETRATAYELGRNLAEMGITVNCAPVVDVPSADCHEFLSGSRTYGDNPDDVAFLGEAVCRGLLDAGVTPIMKHIPGHGRATVDSHLGLPLVKADYDDLSRIDFKPFKHLAASDMKMAVWAMAAHVVYSAIDPDSAATLSRRVTDKVVRGDMGFDGVLLADDVSMKALGGSVEENVVKTMAAGMDLTMLCNASFEDRVIALSAAPTLTATAAARLEAAEKERKVFMKEENNNERNSANA